MADRRHRFFGIEKAGDMALQDFAFKVVAHAACAMAARQQQRIEVGYVDGIPAPRRAVVWIDDHLGIGFAGVAVGP